MRPSSPRFASVAPLRATMVEILAAHNKHIVNILLNYYYYYCYHDHAHRHRVELRIDKDDSYTFALCKEEGDHIQLLRMNANAKKMCVHVLQQWTQSQ